jgi:hypothetical protein
MISYETRWKPCPLLRENKLIGKWLHTNYIDADPMIISSGYSKQISTSLILSPLYNLGNGYGFHLWLTIRDAEQPFVSVVTETASRLSSSGVMQSDRVVRGDANLALWCTDWRSSEWEKRTIALLWRRDWGRWYQCNANQRRDGTQKNAVK